MRAYGPRQFGERREAHAGVRCIVCQKLVRDDEQAWWTPARAGIVCSQACCGIIAAVGREFFPRPPVASRGRAPPDDGLKRSSYA